MDNESKNAAKNAMLKWVGYICPVCNRVFEHHGDWDVHCPTCYNMIDVTNAIKIKEVEYEI